MATAPRLSQELVVFYADRGPAGAGEDNTTASTTEGGATGNNKPALRRDLILATVIGWAPQTSGSACPPEKQHLDWIARGRPVTTSAGSLLEALPASEPVPGSDGARDAGSGDGSVHSVRYLRFLETAHARLLALGDDADPGIATAAGTVPDHSAPRCSSTSRPGVALAGQLSYYAQDRYTPIGPCTAETLRWDLAVGLAAAAELNRADGHRYVFCCPTHPGHHAHRESYGGYCFVNLAAVITRRLQPGSGGQYPKVAIVDVDYHCGNGITPNYLHIFTATGMF